MSVLERVEELRRAQEAAQQEEMEKRQRGLEEARTKNLAAFERFLEETHIREKLEELQKAERPEGEILVRSLTEDNSKIALRLRWVSEWIPEERTELYGIIQKKFPKLYGIIQKKFPKEYQFVSIEWSNDNKVLVRGAQKELLGRLIREDRGRFEKEMTRAIAIAYLNPGRETDLTVMYQASAISD